MKILPVFFLSAVILAQAAGLARAADYYVDSQSGADANDGLAAGRAWRSLERVNRQVFGPGDRILLKACTRYVGQLRPQGSGSLVDGKPKIISLGMYGTGAKPRIDGEGRVLNTVLLRNI